MLDEKGIHTRRSCAVENNVMEEQVSGGNSCNREVLLQSFNTAGLLVPRNEEQVVVLEHIERTDNFASIQRGVQQRRISMLKRISLRQGFGIYISLKAVFRIERSAKRLDPCAIEGGILHDAPVLGRKFTEFRSFEAQYCCVNVYAAGEQVGHLIIAPEEFSRFGVVRHDSHVSWHVRFLISVKVRDSCFDVLYSDPPVLMQGKLVPQYVTVVFAKAEIPCTPRFRVSRFAQNSTVVVGEQAPQYSFAVKCPGRGESIWLGNGEECHGGCISSRFMTFYEYD